MDQGYFHVLDHDDSTGQATNLQGQNQPPRLPRLLLSFHGLHSMAR